MKKLLALVAALFSLNASAGGVTILTNGFLTINDTDLVVGAATSPTGSQQRITSVGNVAWVVGAPATMVNGQTVVVHNVDTVDTITITVGATVIGPACALAPGDNAIITYDNTTTKWRVDACWTAAGAPANFWTLDGTAQTVSADKDMTLSGGVNGFSFDGTTFSVDATNNRIGIGTGTPGSDLDILAQAAANAQVTVTGQFSSATSGGPLLRLVQNDGTPMLVGEGLGKVRGLGFGATAVRIGGTMQWIADETWTDTTSAASWQVLTTPTATVTPVLRLSIAGTGAAAFTPTSIANAFNVDTSVLSVDALNNRVGVNNIAPTSSLFVTNLAAAESIFLALDNVTTVFTIADGGDTTIAPVAGHASDALLVTGGSLASTKLALNVSGTLSATAVGQAGAGVNITGAGAGANSIQAMFVVMGAGYTGSGGSYGLYISNASTGTSTTPLAAFVNPTGNIANYSTSISDGTAGDVVGTYSFASRSTHRNYGEIGVADSDVGSPANIGMYGTAATLGGTPLLIGGMFTLYGQTDSIGTLATSALIVDNAAVAAPIALFRDNGTTVITVADGGATSFAANTTLGDATTDLQVINGDFKIVAGAPTYTTGTCTATSGTGNDVHGTITGTCTAATAIVGFSSTKSVAPDCQVMAKNAAATATVTGLSWVSSTTALTITQSTATVAGIWSYSCIQ